MLSAFAHQTCLKNAAKRQSIMACKATAWAPLIRLFTVKSKKLTAQKKSPDASHLLGALLASEEVEIRRLLGVETRPKLHEGCALRETLMPTHVSAGLDCRDLEGPCPTRIPHTHTAPYS